MNDATKLSEDIGNWIDAHIIASWATQTPKNKHYLAEWEDFKQRAEELEAEAARSQHDLAIVNAAICDLAREVTETDGMGEDGRKDREDYLLEHAYENAVRIVARKDAEQSTTTTPYQIQRITP